jgi:hypothetical protein
MLPVHDLNYFDNSPVCDTRNPSLSRAHQFNLGDLEQLVYVNQYYRTPRTKCPT